MNMHETSYPCIHTSLAKYISGKMLKPEYLEYVKGVASRLFLKFPSGTHGLLEELGRHDSRHDKGGGSQECPNYGACKELVEHVLSESATYDSQRLDFLDYLKTVLPLDAFETFLRDRIFL